jgi:hypothetical protein
VSLRRLAAPVGFGILFLGLQSKLWTGAVSPIWDADTQFAPFFSIVADHARAGSLLLWSSWTNGGAPLYADPQVGALAPDVVLLGALTGGGLGGFVFYWLLLWLGGGLGFLALARHLGVGRAPAIALALGFAMMGPYVGNAEHVSWLHSMSFAPVVLLVVDRALDADPVRGGALAGALWGLSALAGYPGFTVGTLLFTVGWITAWTMGTDWRGGAVAGSWPGRMRTAGLVLAPMLVVGGVVMAPTLFAALHDAAGYTTRAGFLAREAALRDNALEPAAWWTVASGYIGLARRSQWLYTDVSSVSLYVGGCGTLLAALALLGSAWRRALALAALALVFLGLACSRVVPLRSWLSWVLPPLRYFRHSSLFRFYVCLALLLMAVVALRGLATVSARRRRGMAAALAALGMLGARVLERMMADAQPIGYPNHLARWTEARVALAACVVATAGYVLLSGARRQAVRAAAAAVLVTAAVVDARVVLDTNLGLYAKPEVHGGPRWAGIVHRRGILADGPDSHRGRGAPDNLNLLTKERQLENYTPLRQPIFEAIVAGGVLNPWLLGPPRVGFARNVERTPVSLTAYQRWLGAIALDGAVPLLVHTPMDMVRGDGPTGAMSGPSPRDRRPSGASPPQSPSWDGMVPLAPVEVAIGRDRLWYLVDVPEAGWLFVPERWGRPWSVRVDGQRMSPYGGNFAFMAVPVRAGRVELRFRYRPRTTLALVAVSWLVLAGVAAWSICAATRLSAGRRSPPRRAVTLSDP